MYRRQDLPVQMLQDIKVLSFLFEKARATILINKTKTLHMFASTHLPSPFTVKLSSSKYSTPQSNCSPSPPIQQHHYPNRQTPGPCSGPSSHINQISAGYWLPFAPYSHHSVKASNLHVRSFGGKLLPLQLLTTRHPFPILSINTLLPLPQLPQRIQPSNRIEHQTCQPRPVRFPLQPLCTRCRPDPGSIKLLRHQTLAGSPHS